MPQITLQRKQVIALLEFCRDNDITKFFIAKDQGAYVGASKGAGNNCIYYFPGCNPETDADFYETARYQFGGDDFGEHLPVSNLEKVEADIWIDKIVIKVLKTSIVTELVFRPGRPVPPVDTEARKARIISHAMKDLRARVVFYLPSTNEIRVSKTARTASHDPVRFREQMVKKYTDPGLVFLNDIPVDQALAIYFKVYKV